VRIAVVYDNRSLRGNLSPAWGFSCLVGDDLLFDTGGDGSRLLSNMERMGLDVGRIKTVVLSHAHGDHTGGLGALLALNKEIIVYPPRSSSGRFKRQVRARARMVEVHEPMEIAQDIYTTGEIGRGLVEQALVLTTDQGLVIVTGCAHPGIVEMLHRAKQIGGNGIHLALGGFHLSVVNSRKIGDVIAEFRRLGVRKVAPCHCTGRRAMEILAAEYGEEFIEAGVGMFLDIGPNTTTRLRATVASHCC